MKHIKLLQTDFEYCSILENIYEDLQICVGTVDFISCNLYIVGEHVFECSYLSEMLDYLENLGLEVTTITKEPF